jgi:hypothetical protein
VLASYLTGKDDGQSLAAYLDEKVFAGVELETVEPDAEDVAGFDAFLRRYVAALPVERAAVEHS